MNETCSRLPLFAKPFLYDLHLKPCLINCRCEGRVIIDLEILQPTVYLKLHSAEIDIKSASLQLENGSTFCELPFTLEHRAMHLTFTLPNEVDAQKARLVIVFVSRLNDKNMGFCRSSFTDSSGEKRLLAFTQFESFHARKVFPCWDEPEYKAKFKVSLEVDQHLTALSNMPQIAELTVLTGKRIFNFDKTPIMSTYLLAFAVGEFEYIQTKSKCGMDVRVYTTLGKQYLGEFALEVASRSIDWYTEWFATESPLKKCDLLAVPSFAPGAMENWGLIIFRESNLLITSVKSAKAAKITVALAVSHEIAHFWFGNLVTMSWWDGLWLNEGFANWIMNEVIDSLFPSFNVHQVFLRDEKSKALALDSLKSSHPIDVPVENPGELEDIFDTVTYSKSSSIIKMLSSFLGSDVFQQGLCNYLQKHKFGNAKTEDLWNALSEASNQNVDEMMRAWTKQPGYPLISVKQEMVDGDRVLKLRQTRFFPSGQVDQRNSVWQVPIEIITASNPSQPVCRLLMTKPEQEFTLTNVKLTDWIKLNAGSRGFYRVEYTKEMFDSLLEAFYSQKLSVADRFGLASDLFALIQSGRMPVSELLRFLKHCTLENSYTVWSTIEGGPVSPEIPSSGLDKVASLMEHCPDSHTKDIYNTYICACLGPVIELLDSDSDNVALKSLIFNRLAKSGHKLIIDMALQLFDQHAEEATLLASDLRAVVFGCAARQNNLTKMESLVRIYSNCNVPDIEKECLHAMGQCSNKDLLASVYKCVVEEGNGKPQDIVHLFVGSQTSKIGQEFGWEYFKCHHKLLFKKFGFINKSFKDVMKIAAHSLYSTYSAQDLQMFCKSNFDRNQLKDLESTIEAILESILLNHKLYDVQFQDIAQFLNDEEI